MVPVKVPKEVLELFPKWEYRCPCCGTYIESVESFCPNCKTVFDEERWRIPPRFLKSQEAMSEYAHNVLAPKLSSEQRKLLFLYFTEFFSDGFESGDFSEWTGTTGTPTIVTSPVHHGTYSASYASDGEYSYVTFSALQTFYCRFYFRFDTLPASDSWQYLMFYRTAGPNTELRVQQKGDSDTYFRYRNAAGSYNDVVWNPSVDTWYCIEHHVYVDPSSGVESVWINDVQFVDRTSVNTGSTDVYQVRIGQPDSTYSVTTYSDCVVVADAKIGPETEEQTYTKTWTSDALFKKLGLSKTVTLDVALQERDVLKSFGADAAFQRSLTVQNSVDALFKRFDIQRLFGVDAYFGGLSTITVSRNLDALFKTLGVVKPFGLDCFLGPVDSVVCSRTFGLGVVFAYKVRLPELWLDENGKLVFNISKPYVWVGV